MWESCRRQVWGLWQKPEKTEPDYREYYFSAWERGRYGAAALAIVLGMAWIFYQDLRMCLPLLPIGVWYLVKKRGELQRERQQRLAVEFKDLILAVTASMQTGHSVENAFLEAGRDLAAIHGAEADMCRELSRMQAGIRNNLAVEQLLYQLGRRSGVTEMEEFTGIFMIAKRSGGNLKEMVRRTAQMTEDKLEIREEIQVILSERVYEQKIMRLAPFGLILYLKLTSPGFFDRLYHNPLGICVMTVCLGLYLAAGYLAGKISDIKV